MAQESQTATASTATRQPPVLQPGRPADPPEIAGDSAEEVTVAVPGDGALADGAGSDESDQASPKADSLKKTDSGQAMREQGEEQSDQIQRQRRLLRQCERALLLDFDVLAIPDWPDDHAMAVARQRRDLWLFATVLAAIVFLCGVPGFVPAWIAGSAFGATAVLLLAGTPFMRHLYRQSPSYLDLRVRRRQRLLTARRHVAHLEGIEGLAWQCAMMAEFNPALLSTRFSRLVRLSEQRKLIPQMRQREHMRLYLGFMLEAEKAYKRLERVWFERHQQSIDEG